MTEDSDDRMMAVFQHGQVSGFDRLYAKYRQPLHGYLYRHCRDDALTEELFQDVWLRVVSAAAGYQKRGRFRSWLFSLAHNRLVDHYRRNQANPTFTDEDSVALSEDQQAVSGPEALDQSRLRQNLDVVIQMLPLEQKSVFFLREEAGLALKEIAEIQGISIEAAKSRLRYAYQKLRRALSEREVKA